MSEIKTTRTPGLLPSIIDLFKRLVAEDPIIAAVFGTTYIPVALQLLEAFARREPDRAFLAVLVLSVITIIVIIPLLVVRVYRIRMNQKNEAEKKNQENKQKQFNAIMKAKIDTIKAEKDFILSQSERHEQLLLREAAKDIKAGIEERFDAIQVGSVVSNLNKIEKKYLDLEKGLVELQKSLGILLNDKHEIEFDIRDKHEEPTDVYTKSLELTLKDLTSGYETAKSQIKEQSSTIDELKKELEFQFEQRLREDSDTPEGLPVPDKIITDERKEQEKKTWQCSKCKRIVDNKKPRCPRCGKSKKA